MFEVRDPALKLFGRDIPLESTHIIDSPQVMNSYDKSVNQNDLSEEAKGLGNVHKSPTQEVEAEVVDRTKDYKAASRDKDHQEKVLKKPDKVLPCPRCNSLETKFCYFNNYNVNQPRHFCKNCQRYWTAGGTIRNVPVGAGKRKNKHSALPVAPDVVSITHTDSNGLPTASRNIPSFGVEAPLCESLETLLDLKGQKKIEVNFITNRDDSEEPSRAAESNEKESSENGKEQVGLPQHCNNGFNPLHPIHYYPVPPWAYQWGSCWNSMVFRPSPAYMGSLETTSLLAGIRLHTSDPPQTPPRGSLVHWDAHPTYMGSATKMEVPGFIGPTIELPAAPSLYWGIPSPSSSTSNSVCSGTKSPTLGKHSRDVSTQAGDTVKQNLWVPKTLRINDPEEAARSSIWSTLGAKPEQNKPIIKGSVFKSFEPNKSDASSNISNTEEFLSANPAALSRSESFQERM